MLLQLTNCPETSCGHPAEVTDRFVLGSTDGPIEHVRIYCLGKHIFTLPSGRMASSEFVQS